jgi:hypothetical protein
MRKYHFQLEVYATKALTALMLLSGLWIWSSCKDDDGLEAGDPNYFTSSRGQFTATQDDGTTLFLLPGSTSGSATLTYDGSNPRHWQSETNANVNVTTYQGDLTLSETLTANGQRYTLTAIGSEALMGCRSLTSVVLPATIKSLGEGAFAICTTLTTVNIPEGVTDIPTGCFGYCQKLTTMVLPSTVKTLGAMAFFGCSGLTAMTLPEGLTSIGERCFFDCSKLTEITIPSTVKTIGSRCFGGRSATDRSKIAVYHMLSSTPPTLEGVLYEAQEGVTPVIKVPAGAVAAYQAAAGWSTLTIEEEDAQ